MPASPTRDATVRQLTRGKMWLAYLIGAFGLAMNAQAHLLVPLRARELGATFDLIGLIVAAGAIAPALFAIVLGSIVDRLGPKRAFILGALLAGTIAVGLMLASSYWVLLGLQFLYGASRSLGWVASQTYITSIGTPQQRSTIAGRFGFFSNAGPMIGPLIAGGVAQLVGIQLAFIVIVAYAYAFAIIGVFLVDPRSSAAKAKRHKGVGFRVALGLLRNQGMQVVLLLSGARLWTNWVYAAFVPVYLTDAGVAVGLVGTVATVRALVSTITAPMAGALADRLGKQVGVAVGLCSGAVGLAITPYFISVPGFYLPAVLIGIAIGLSLPLLLSIVGDVVAEEQRGVALGLRVSFNQTAAAAAPTIVGPIIAATGAIIGFTVSGGVAALLVVASLTVHRFALRTAGDGRE